LKKLRVALVEAGSSATHVYSRTYLPRVGIPTLGAILKKRGWECEIWFQSMPKMDEARLREYDIVGIGSITCTIPEAYRLGDSLRSAGTCVVIGGPHATFMPEEALEHADYVVLGEGDESFPALVEALAEERVPDEIPGLVFRRPDGSLHRTDLPAPVDYAALPAPDFRLAPQVGTGEIPPIIVTSRGCPHACNFCGVTAVFGRRYRFRTNEQVISELRPILHRSVCFGDDNFCARPERTKSLLREMIAQDAVPLRWTGEMCVRDAADEELLELLQKTDCRTMFVGVESVDAATLKRLGKSHDVDAVGRCVKNLHRHGVGIHGMFMVDADNDVADVRRLIDYAIATDIDTIQIFPLTPLPGTAAYEELSGRLLHREWGRYDGMHVVVEPRRCSAYEQQMAILDGLKRFYRLRRVITAWRRGRGWRVKYRFGGRYLTHLWIKENAEYLERLRTGFYRPAPGGS